MRDASQTTLLLVGHGTRDPEGLRELRLVARQLSEACAPSPVEHAFLELAEPGIAAAVDQCAQRGARHIIVQPLLLFAAGHVRRDVPAEVARAAARNPQVELTIAPHLGCHPRLLELSELRFSESLANLPPRDDRDTMLLMVGRGSRDAEANDEMARFSRLRWEQRQTTFVDTCFLAMAHPTLADGLAAAARLARPRVIVQPQLLFHGELLTRLETETAAAAALRPDLEWIVAAHLGPHPLLVQAIASLSGFAGSAV